MSPARGPALSDPELVEGESKGFTLIELLVVIAIIAILSVVGIVLFTGVQKGARDARRKGDVDAIAKAYEVKNAAGRYLAIADSDFAGAKKPQDPDPAKGDYFNWLDSTGAGFKICASLDSNPSNACNTPAANCYCKFSSQGTVPSGSAADTSSSTQFNLGYGGSNPAPSCDPDGTLYAGLVGYWKMDDASWNGTPGEVIDSSGNGNNGTAAGVASMADHIPDPLGYFKKAGIFDGSSGYISIGNPQNLQMNTILTVEFWTYITKLSSYEWIITKGVPWSTGWFFGKHDGEQGIRVTFIGTNGYNGSPLIPMNFYEWTHIVFTFDNGKAIFYKNGNLSWSDTPPTTIIVGTDAIDLELGRMSLDGGYFQGSLDDVRIYNRALSPQEVTNLYNSSNGCI